MDRKAQPDDRGAAEHAQVEWHLAREQGDAYGDALARATQLATDSGERRTGDYWITYLLDSPRRIYTWADGKPRWQEPEGANLYVGIAIRDATDGRFMPAVSVAVTLIDEAGRMVGAGEQSLVWDPLAHQYGRNWQVQGTGPHSMCVRIEPSARVQSDGVAPGQVMRPLEVEFADLNLTFRQVSGGRRAPGAAMAEQDLL
jgi:hypothetical protein